MSEPALAYSYRKSQLFLHSLIPVVKTHDELVRDKLKRGKFLFTKTGFIKLIGILVLLVGLSLFLVKSECPEAAEWYKFLFPIALGIHIIGALTIYLVFAFGLTVKNPGFWVKVDIWINMLLSIATIVSSAMTDISCSASGILHRIPGPVGIAGGAIMIISCAAILLLYRFREEEVTMVPGRRESGGSGV